MDIKYMYNPFIVYNLCIPAKKISNESGWLVV